VWLHRRRRWRLLLLLLRRLLHLLRLRFKQGCAACRCRCCHGAGAIVLLLLLALSLCQTVAYDRCVQPAPPARPLLPQPSSNLLAAAALQAGLLHWCCYMGTRVATLV
jgi:hypothetical protein